MEPSPDFQIYFNRNRQRIDVWLWDVHPDTFQNWGGGRWAYFEKGWESPRSGKFGDLHFVKSGVREDTVAHEMFHVLCEWMWANRTAITARNEERFAKFLDQLVGRFHRLYRKRMSK